MRQSLDKWIEEMRVKRIWSKQTVQNRSGWAKRFVNFFSMRCNITHITDLKPQHLQLYYEERAKPFTKATQSCEMDILSSFFKYCLRSSILLSSPLPNWKKHPRTIADRLISPEDIQKVLRAVDTSTPDGIQDRAIIETFYATGIRRFELVNLNLSDIDISLGQLWVIGGKGEKDRILPIIKSALCWINLYLKKSRPYLVRFPECQSLFIGKAGGRASNAHIQRLINRVQDKTKVTPLSSHVFRHACATHLMQAGVNIIYIQKLLGHENIRTTQRYLHTANTQLKKVYDQSHPREQWNIGI